MVGLSCSAKQRLYRTITSGELRRESKTFNAHMLPPIRFIVVARKINALPKPLHIIFRARTSNGRRIEERPLAVAIGESWGYLQVPSIIYVVLRLPIDVARNRAIISSRSNSHWLFWPVFFKTHVRGVLTKVSFLLAYFCKFISH